MMILAVIAFLLGTIFFWSCGCLGFHDVVISSYGAILTMVSLCILIVYGLCVNGANKLLSAITGLLIFMGIFFFACFVDLVAFMPSSEQARTVYGILCLPFLLSGGGSATTQIIIRKFM